MATLEVTLKYRPPLARLMLLWIALLSPIWLGIPLLSMIVPLLGLTARFREFFVGLGYIPLGEAALFFYGPLAFVGLWLYASLRDNKIVISQQGICFPFSTSLLLFGRRNRSWYDLKSIELTPSHNQNENSLLRGLLKLQFSSGGVVHVRLRELPLTQVEQFLMAIETFAPSAQNLQLLTDAKRELGEELKVAGIKSYTNLWEDELRYRYSSTTFIPLAPGQKLQDGKLKVVRQLGFGGLSAIYLVQQGGKDLCALKESTVPGDVEDEMKTKAIEMFDREASILAKLSHPQIAKVHDHFVEDNRHYLLLQYVHGEDLRQHVKEHGPMSDLATVKCAIQIASILQYLHNAVPSVIHRDLTPENLVIDDSGKIVLIDFGAANEFLQTATGTLVGKHAYIAPEQFKGRATTASDLYALGGTIFFLLTGSDPTALACSSPRKSNPAVSEELDLIVQSLTRLSLKERVATADDAVRALSTLKTTLEGEHGTE